MKIKLFMKLALAGFVLVSITNAVDANDKDDQQILTSSIQEDFSKSKRPFCNAFTGCGKKRNYYESKLEAKQPRTIEKIEIPVTFYKALIRGLSQEIRNAIDPQEFIDERVSESLYQDYSPISTLRRPIRKRYQS